MVLCAEPLSDKQTKKSDDGGKAYTQEHLKSLVCSLPLIIRDSTGLVVSIVYHGLH